MPDFLDEANATADFFREKAIADARREAAKIPVGEPGECIHCGEHSPRLVNLLCVPCREREERLFPTKRGVQYDV